MKPSELSSRLRQIASGIDKAKAPLKSLVARDLRAILARFALGPGQFDVTFDEVSIIRDGFDGDAERYHEAAREFSDALTDRGLTVDDYQPGALRISGDPNAFRALCDDATSERPDDDVDLLSAFLADAVIKTSEAPQ